MEYWLPVPSIPELEASTMGRIRLSSTKVEVTPRIGKGVGSYMFVSFDGRAHYVHRLVAETFLHAEPSRHGYDGKMGRAARVRFVSGDRTDCAVSNLVIDSSVPPTRGHLEEPTTGELISPDEVDRVVSRIRELNPLPSSKKGRVPRAKLYKSGVILPIPSSGTIDAPDSPEETLEALFALNPHLSEEILTEVFDFYYLDIQGYPRRQVVYSKYSGSHIRLSDGVLRYVRFATQPDPIPRQRLAKPYHAGHY